MEGERRGNRCSWHDIINIIVIDTFITFRLMRLSSKEGLKTHRLKREYNDEDEDNRRNTLSD